MEKKEAQTRACYYLVEARMLLDRAHNAVHLKERIHVIKHQIDPAQHARYFGDIRVACDQLHTIVYELGSLVRIPHPATTGDAPLKTGYKPEVLSELVVATNYVNKALEVLRPFLDHKI